MTQRIWDEFIPKHKDKDASSLGFRDLHSAIWPEDYPSLEERANKASGNESADTGTRPVLSGTEGCETAPAKLSGRGQKRGPKTDYETASRLAEIVYGALEFTPSEGIADRLTAESMAESDNCDSVKAQIWANVRALVRLHSPQPLLPGPFRTGNLSDPVEKELYSVLEQGGHALVHCLARQAAKQTGGSMIPVELLQPAFAFVSEIWVNAGLDATGGKLGLYDLSPTLRRLERILYHLNYAPNPVPPMVRPTLVA
jgi:hypothetical protein